jgi:L-lactate dehydrogenase complex protein LldG
MSGSNSARERILARVRAALTDRDHAEHPGPLEPVFTDVDEGTGSEPSSVLERFRDRFEHSGGEVMAFDDLDAIRSWLVGLRDGLTPGDAGERTTAFGEHVPDVLRDALPAGTPAGSGLGVSMASWACARTGTVVLDARDGRRAQLLPPVHVVLVERSRVVDTLGAALSCVRDALPSAVGLHSGPSKSADIGRIIVTGVHGPGRVIVALVP